MGNHEYCEDCGENNFHNERPCNPEKVADRKAMQDRNDRILQANISRMKNALASAGIQYEMDEYGNAIVRPSYFAEDR
jgi:hypothetical protein